MSAYNRRSLVAVAAAFAAAGLHACSITPARASEEDAQLLWLGAEFDRTLAEWRPLWREMWRLHDAWAEVLKARELSFAVQGDDACWAVNEEIGGRAASEASNLVLDRLEALASEIKAIPPKTVAGIAVWARVARFECVSPFDLEKPQADLDLDVQHLLGFLAMIEQVAARQAVAS